MSKPKKELYIVVGQYQSYKNGGWETEIHCRNSGKKAMEVCNEFHKRFCDGETICHKCRENEENDEVSDDGENSNIDDKPKENNKVEEHKCEYSCECGYVEGDLDFTADEFNIQTYVEDSVNFSIYGIQNNS